MTEYIISRTDLSAIQRTKIDLYGGVELVRCKDCKYNNGSRCGWHGGAGYKWIVDDDDYCSCAERKEE